MENDCMGNSDVVIVVPTHMENLPEAPSRPDHSHRICIDEADMEPNSPKTITESSSEFKNILFCNIFQLRLNVNSRKN
jgi:hypothetical protein